jgi:hypothetical protein
MLKKSLLALALLAIGIFPAAASTLLGQLAITTAIATTTATPVTSFSAVPPQRMAVQANFVYGSGGTTVDAYLQTSLDQGTTWVDVANWHFTTTSARFIYSLSALTPNSTQVTPTDGTMTANTAKDGVLGNLWRVKYASTGTYAATTLQIDMISGS